MGTVAAATAAGASAAPVKPAMLTPAQIAHERELYAPVPFRFDRERFAAAVGKPYAHRQVTCATSYQSSVDALSRMQKTVQTFADPNGFDAGAHATHVAAVLYGSVSYAISLDDAMFAKYPIAFSIDADLHPGDSTYTSYFATVHTNENAEDYRALVADHDAAFFVCNHALSGYAVDLATRMLGASAAVTRERVIAIHDDLAARSGLFRRGRVRERMRRGLRGRSGNDASQVNHADERQRRDDGKDDQFADDVCHTGPSPKRRHCDFATPTYSNGSTVFRVSLPAANQGSTV